MKTKHKEEKLKNTNKIKVKNNRKIIIIHIHNKMPAVWDSKVMFVSGSQFWGLALYSPFWSVSGPFVIPHLIISLGGRQKKVGGGKREDPKGKGKKKKKMLISLLLTLNLLPIQQVLLVFLDATGRRGWASLFSLPLVLRGWRPGLGHTIHSFLASDPGLLWAVRLKSATHLLTVSLCPAQSPRQAGHMIPLCYCLWACSARLTGAHISPLPLTLGARCSRQAGCTVELSYCLWACSARQVGCTFPLHQSL